MIENFLQAVRNFIDNDLIFQITLSVSIILSFVLIAKVFSFVLRKLIKPIVRRTSSAIDDKILFIIENSSFRLTLLLGIYFGLVVFKDGFEHISIKTHLKLIQEYPYLIRLVDIIEDVFFVVLIFMLLVIVAKIFVLVVDRYAEKYSPPENKDMVGNLFPLLKKTGRLLLFIIASIVILAKFKVDISAFIVSFGVGSLAIALAAQETLSNMISGFIIMIDKPFRIGDRIKIGNDIHGDVEGIGIRSTKILDFNSNILIIPNNDVVKSRIINLTYPTSLTGVVIDISVSYGVDIDRIKAILLNIAENDPEVDRNEKPEVSLVKFGEAGLELKVTLKTVDYRNAFNLSCRLREAIYKKFQEEKIEFPRVQRVVELIKN